MEIIIFDDDANEFTFEETTRRHLVLEASCLVMPDGCGISHIEEWWSANHFHQPNPYSEEAMLCALKLLVKQFIVPVTNAAGFNILLTTDWDEKRLRVTHIDGQEVAYNNTSRLLGSLAIAVRPQQLRDALAKAEQSLLQLA